MGSAVAYSDVPEGFQVKDAPATSYSDLPEGFSVKPSAPAKESAVADVAKTVASMPERMVAGGAMALPNIINSAVAGPQLLGRGIAEGVDKLTGTTPQPRGEIWQPFNSSEDALQSLPKPLRPHTPTTPAGVVADTAGNIATNMLAPKVAPKLGEKVEPLIKDESAAAQPKPPIPPAADIAKEAKAAYEQAEASGSGLTPSFMGKVADSLDEFGARDPVAKRIIGDPAIAPLIEKFKAERDSPLSLQGFEDIDKYLTGQISAHYRQGLDSEGKAFMDFQDKLRGMVDDVSEGDASGGKAGFDSLKTATAKWSQAARMRDLDAIIDNATRTDNPATALKTGFRTLAKNDKRMRGFTEEEKTAIKHAAESGELGDVFRTFGSRLNPIIRAATGGSIGGDIASYVGSKFSRDAAEGLAMKRANDARRLVASRKMPVAKALSPSQVDPEVAARLNSTNPASQAIGGY